MRQSNLLQVAPAPPGDRFTGSRPDHRAQSSALPGWQVLFVVVGLLVGISIIGFPYYVLPMAERVRHPLHPWLRPSGYIGQSAGILSITLMGFLWLYPVRKRFRWLAFTGSVARWLELHVLAALALPLIAAIHAAWRFDGVIGLGYAAMMIVWLSGIVGRYLYTRIPRSRAGVELTLEEIGAQRAALLQELSNKMRLPPERLESMLAAAPPRHGGGGLLGAVGQMVADDLARRRAARRLRRLWRASHARRQRGDRTALRRVLWLARREMVLTQHVRLLDATRSLLRYWHIAHRPVAIGALIAVSIHVAVVVALGATWFW